MESPGRGAPADEVGGVPAGAGISLPPGVTGGVLDEGPRIAPGSPMGPLGTGCPAPRAISTDRCASTIYDGRPERKAPGQLNHKLENEP